MDQHKKSNKHKKMKNKSEDIETDSEWSLMLDKVDIPIKVNDQGLWKRVHFNYAFHAW